MGQVTRFLIDPMILKPHFVNSMGISASCFNNFDSAIRFIRCLRTKCHVVRSNTFQSCQLNPVFIRTHCTII